MIGLDYKKQSIPERGLCSAFRRPSQHYSYGVL